MSHTAEMDPRLLAEMDPEELGRFLKELRTRLGMKQHEVAARAGVHPSYLSHLEAGKKDLRRASSQVALALLKAYGLGEAVALEIIRRWGEKALPGPDQQTQVDRPEPRREPPEDVPLKPIRLPVVEAGAGSPTWDDAREFLSLHLPDLRGKERRIFGVKIVGDSMEPLLYEGDIAIVWTEGGYSPGSIVAIGIPSNGIVVKQIYYGPKGEALMHSLNPLYPDQPLPEGAKVWGPVIQVVRSLPGGKPGRHLFR